MATNSIKDNLTKSEIISELLLSIKGDVKKEYIHLPKYPPEPLSGKASRMVC